MKVILTSDVKPLGGRGTLVDVKDGYANNYLLPNRLAVAATPGAMKQLEQQQSAKKRKQAEEVANAQDVAAYALGVEEEEIELKDGIKALGTYPVEIRLGNNVIAKSAVQVVALK